MSHLESAAGEDFISRTYQLPHDGDSLVEDGGSQEINQEYKTK